MNPQDEANFRSFVVAASPGLHRFGWLLTHDKFMTEDIVQTSLVRAYPRWLQIQDGSPEAYVRRVMVRSLSSWRRKSMSTEVPVATFEQGAAAGGNVETSVIERQLAKALLRELSSRQRAIVIMRFYLDMTETEVASQLNISIGTVKSTASRALANVRTLIDEFPHEQTGAS